MTDRLTLSAVEVTYGKLPALHPIDLSVPRGRLVLLLGANGAGKSSLLRAIMGLVDNCRGTILVDGEPIERLPAHRRAGRGIAYLPEGRGVFPSLTVQENILAGVAHRRSRADALEAAYELFPRLAERRTQVAGSLSGGEQQMLSLSRALAGFPRLLLLDELSLGLAPRIVETLFAKVGELRDEGMSILLVEQFAHAALGIADFAGVIARGRMTRFGPTSELATLSPDELAAEYFGSDDAAENADSPVVAPPGAGPSDAGE